MPSGNASLCNPGLKPLEDLLNNRAAGHEAEEVLLPDDVARFCGQEFNPYGSVDQNHLRRRSTLGVPRGRSSLFEKVSSQIRIRKTCGCLVRRANHLFQGSVHSG